MQFFLADSEEVIRKKVMKAVSDAGPTHAGQEKSEAVKNLFTLMEVVSKPETIQFFEEKYNDLSIRYGDMKKQLAEDMQAFIKPLSEKIKEISADDAYLQKVIRTGKEKAHASASVTMNDVREIMGISYTK